MASTLRTVPLLRAVQTRAYSAAASVPVCGVPNCEVETSTLPNRATVVSVNNQSQICRVSVLFKAGARCETFDNAGTAHMLRICAGLTTASKSQFAIIRNVQQLGAGIKCSTDREVVAYTLEGTPDAVEELLPFLKAVAVEQEFRPWEVSDNLPRVRLELATRPPQQRTIDLFHKAAYRSGLGNSIYISKHQLGKISSEDLLYFTKTNFTSDRAAIVGWGLPHKTVASFATSLGLPNGKPDFTPSPYKGGEIRSDKGGDLAFVAIGTEGAPGANLKEALAFAVLKKVYGTSPAVRPWGGSSAGLISKMSTSTSSAKAFSLNYSDSGLFGALIAAPAKDAGAHVDGAVKILKSANITDADITRGKNQLKRSILSAMESGFESSYRLGVGALFNKQALNGNQVAALVDEVSAEDVKAAARKVSSGKLTITAVGNLRTVPFLSDLK